MNVVVLAAAAGLFGLFGNPHDSDIQPVTSLVGRNCAAAPDLASPMVLQYAGKEKSTDAAIEATAPCVLTSSGAALYRVFQLPPRTALYVITVVSMPFGASLLSPRLLLLDAQGTVKRELARDDLIFRGNDLSARFRSHPDEVYLVVESDAGLVGNALSRTAESTNVYVSAAANVIYSIHTGNDVTMQYVYSHTGPIEITLEPLPTPH
jgi:hypothetical protein